jgi:hypothetical protein
VKRLFSAWLAVVAMALALPGATLADTPISQVGVTGYYYLLDSYDNTGATCVYRTLYSGGNYWQGKLVRLNVDPPVVYGAHDYVQRVGWNFYVTRQIGRRTTRTYTSPTQKGWASYGSLPNFYPKTVGVTVPKPLFAHDYRYRVYISMFWYRADGTTEGLAVDRIDFFYRQSPMKGDTSSCHGVESTI